MRCAIYARASEHDPCCRTQLAELRDYCKRMGWEPVEYVEDKSSKRGRERRPVLAKIMADARRKQFSVIAVWDLDCFCSSVRSLISEIDNLVGRGVRFVAPWHGLDTDDNCRLRLVDVIREFVDYDHALRTERAKRLGVPRYELRWQDSPLGRPIKYFDRRRAIELRKLGKSWRGIGAELNVPHATVRRAVLQSAEFRRWSCKSES